MTLWNAWTLLISVILLVYFAIELRPTHLARYQAVHALGSSMYISKTSRIM